MIHSLIHLLNSIVQENTELVPDHLHNSYSLDMAYTQSHLLNQCKIHWDKQSGMWLFQDQNSQHYYQCNEQYNNID